jgi:hypothetical protein
MGIFLQLIIQIMEKKANRISSSMILCISLQAIIIIFFSGCKSKPEKPHSFVRDNIVAEQKLVTLGNEKTDQLLAKLVSMDSMTKFDALLKVVTNENIIEIGDTCITSFKMLIKGIILDYQSFNCNGRRQDSSIMRINNNSITSYFNFNDTILDIASLFDCTLGDTIQVFFKEIGDRRILLLPTQIGFRLAATPLFRNLNWALLFVIDDESTRIYTLLSYMQGLSFQVWINQYSLDITYFQIIPEDMYHLDYPILASIEPYRLKRGDSMFFPMLDIKKQPKRMRVVLTEDDPYGFFK